MKKGRPKRNSDVLIGLLRSGMWNARDMIKRGRMYGAPHLKKDREDWGLVLSSHNRKEGNCRRMNDARKGSFCREKKVYYWPYPS